MDFVHDRTMTGPLRTLSVLDLCTRQAPVLTAARSMPSERVIRILEQAAKVYGLPERIVVDNGPEFTSRSMQRWAEGPRHRASLHRTGQADAERVHRELQRPASRRVPQRARLLERAGGPNHTRTMETVLQRGAAPRVARRSNPKRIRPGTHLMSGRTSGQIRSCRGGLSLPETRSTRTDWCAHSSVAHDRAPCPLRPKS